MNPIKMAVGDFYRSIEIARRINNSQPSTQYPFMDTAKFQELLKADVSLAMKTYWYEILLRSHMCAVSGLKRFLDWIDAVEKSEDNYILYCSSLRGLMECAGDTYHGLSEIAISLAEDHKTVREGISGQMKTVVIAQEWEDKLIHFTHASKQRAKALGQKEIQPKQSKEYVELLEKGSKIKFYSYYQTICEIVHPASDSLGYNFEGDDNGILRWSGRRDSEVITMSVVQNKELITELLMRGLNPIFILMKTINLFDQKELRIPGADAMSLDSLPAWTRITTAMKA